MVICNDFESEVLRLRRLLQESAEDLARERRRHLETQAWYEAELTKLRNQLDPKGKRRAD